MKTLARSLLVLAMVVSALAAPVGPLEWPAIAAQTKPWSRWWWLGNIGTPQDFTTEMEKYARAGLGGLEITPIYGVRGQEERFRAYLSPEWMNLLDHVLDEGERLGLGIDMSTGTGWPFGGPWVTRETAARHVVSRVYTVKPGERLAEPVTATDQPVVRVAGPRRSRLEELKDPVVANENLQDLALDQVRFPRRLALQTLVAHAPSGQKVDLTTRVDAEGRLDWVAPALPVGGDAAAAPAWTLYALFIGWHGKQVERAGPGGEGDAIDHFSSAALAQYLARFDAAYRGHRPGRLRAYFNDSYEVDDASGEANWTPRFLDEFKRRRGYDLRDELPAFCGRDTPEKNDRVMADHRETISDLLLEEFTVPWAKWAHGHGSVIRNQAHGSPANLLDLYAASDIPETEGTNVVGMKLASSAAHLTGRALVSAETATWLDEHWLSTLHDLKRRVDLMFLGGVNHNCYHGTVFSPPAEPWPGHHFYASVELDPSNPIWAEADVLNAYVARCQSFLQLGRPAHDVLLYYPIHDAWAERGRRGMPHFAGGARPGGQEIAAELLARGYTYDFVSDRLLAGVRAAGGALESGGVRYRALVVSDTKRLPPETMARLLALAEGGASIVFHQGIPSDVPGLTRLAERRAELERQTAALRRAAADAEGIASVARGRGRVLCGAEWEKLLSRAGVRRETLADRGLHFVRRTIDADRVYYLLNGRETAFAGWVPLEVAAPASAIFDPMSGARGVAATRRTTDGRLEVYLRLAPAEACLVRTLATPPAGAAWSYWETGDTPPQPLAGAWRVSFATGGPTLPPAAELGAPRSWTELAGEAYRAFSGTGVYSVSFDRPAGAAEAWQLDLGAVAASARVRLNGREIAALISPPFRVTIPAAALQPRNTLEIAVSSLAVNRLADLDRRDPSWKKFYNTNYPARLPANRGADGNFSAAKWEPQPSGLLGPVTLTPLVRLSPTR